MKTGLELIEALDQDPVAGWRALVDAYSNLVWSIARGMRLGQEDAEEVFQNTWLLLYRNIANIRDARSLSAWIATTTRREALLLIRRGQLRRDSESHHGEDHQHISSECPDDSVLSHEEGAILGAALAELSPRCRKILSELYFSPEEPTYKKLSAELGMPIGSLGPTRIRCLERLAQLLEKRGV